MFYPFGFRGSSIKQLIKNTVGRIYGNNNAII